MQSNTWKVTVAKYKGIFYFKTIQEQVHYLDEFAIKLLYNIHKYVCVK